METLKLLRLDDVQAVRFECPHPDCDYVWRVQDAAEEWPGDARRQNPACPVCWPRDKELKEEHGEETRKRMWRARELLKALRDGFVIELRTNDVAAAGAPPLPGTPPEREPPRPPFPTYGEGPQGF